MSNALYNIRNRQKTGFNNMINVTIKTTGSKGSTFQADMESFFKIMNYYRHENTKVYYKNLAGWQSLSGSVANMYKHTLAYTERVVIYTK